MLPPTARQRICALGVFALGLGATACKDSGPGKLFEEDGVWSLQRFTLDGGTPIDINEMTRGDAFQLKFNAGPQVVTAAWCGSMETDDPITSTCRLDTDAMWFCRCFAYAYEDDQMIWREFDAGNAPPDVPFDPDAASGGGGGGTGTGTGGGDGGMTGGDTLIQLGEVPNITSTYSFRGLPSGLFGSQGDVSQFIFQQKSPTIFGEVDCSPVCIAD